MAAAAARFVLLRGADDDGLARVRRRSTVDEPLRRRRRTAAAVADGLELVHELGMREELGHRSERESPEVLVEPGDDHPRRLRPPARAPAPTTSSLEELHLVDPDDLEALRRGGELRDRRDGNRAHARAGMAHDVGRVVAVVDHAA